ncbi:MAG: dynamin family protein [Bacteroidales bacterium]|nr:dynamin family protein [Bacteroidales bacterium]
MIERAQIQSIIDRLKENSRIDGAFCNELDDSFESQTLYIGVVGKMKVGKSSLVNSVVFGDTVLSSGVAPTTVTLTEISYSEEERVIVEMMTSQDVEELKSQAAYNGDEQTLKLKAEAASSTLKSFPKEYERHLNLTEQTIKLSDLHEYIDANGKYSGLAKSVKIFINNENLKGVTIIDTPGFNDPIVSRGEATKRVLSKCHVLLFVHDKDGYDNSDVRLLTEQIEYAGISEVVDILNKVDMLSTSIDEWPDELEYFVQGRNEIDIQNSNVKSLLSKSRATYISSLMALCGLVPYDKMNDDLKEQFGNFEEYFEELCQGNTREQQQHDFVRYSNVNSVIAEINRLSKDGSVYLIEGPLNTIKGRLSSIKNTIESEIETKKASLESLQVGIEASKRSLDNFEEFMFSAMRDIKSSSLSLNLSQLVLSSIKQSRDLRASASSSEFSEERYPEPGLFTTGVSKDNVASYNTFVSGFENQLRDVLENLKDSFRNECKKEVNELITNLSSTSYIDTNHMKLLRNSLENTLIATINDTDIIVPSKRLSSVPNGTQKHWDKFRSAFLNTYDDLRLSDKAEDGIFLGMSQTAKDIDFVYNARLELDDLREIIKKSLNKSPLQKQNEKEKIESKISSLESEIKSITSDIDLIEELTKKVKEND